MATWKPIKFVMCVGCGRYWLAGEGDKCDSCGVPMFVVPVDVSTWPVPKWVRDFLTRKAKDPEE